MLAGALTLALRPPRASEVSRTRSQKKSCDCMQEAGGYPEFPSPTTNGLEPKARGRWSISLGALLKPGAVPGSEKHAWAGLPLEDSRCQVP